MSLNHFSLLEEKTEIPLKNTFEKLTLSQKNKKPLPRSKFLWILLSMNLMWAGMMTFFDFPQLFESVLIKSKNLTTFQVEFFYSATTGPGLLVTILSAYFLNKIGLGKAGVVSAAFAFYGILICFYTIYQGKSSKSTFFWVSIGRVIFGIGLEIGNIVQITVAEKWFSGSFLSISVSLNRFFVFFGMSLAAYFLPSLYIKKRNLDIVLFGYAIFCLVSFIANLSYFIAEKKNEKILEEIEENREKKKNSVEEEKYTSYKPDFKDMWNSNLLVKLSICITGTYVAIYYAFTNFVTDMLINRFSFTYSQAKNKVAILPVFGLIFTPIFSIIVSKIGKKGVFIAVSGILVLSSFIIMYFLPENPGDLIYIPFSLLGLYYGLYNSVVWSAMAFVSPRQLTSMVVALGIGFMSFNMTIFPLFFGVVTEDRDFTAYNNALFWLCVLGCVCLVLGVLIMVVDLRGEKVLHTPENDDTVQEIRDNWSRELFFKRKRENSE